MKKIYETKDFSYLPLEERQIAADVLNLQYTAAAHALKNQRKTVELPRSPNPVIANHVSRILLDVSRT